MLLTLLLVQAGGDLPSTWGIIQTGGIAGLLFLALYMVFSGRIPTKQQLAQMAVQLEQANKDRDFWRDLALKGTNLVEKHVQVTDEEVAMRLQVMETNMAQQLREIQEALKPKGPDGA